MTKPAEEKGNETIANSDMSPKNEGGVNVDALNESDERIINGEAVLPDQPSLFDGGVLRKYQIDGFTWLKVRLVSLSFFHRVCLHKTTRLFNGMIVLCAGAV